MKKFMKTEEHIELEKLEFGACFFCDRLVIIRDKRLLSLEDIENFRKLFGCVPERLGTMIGNKIICKSCKADICTMVQNSLE